MKKFNVIFLLTILSGILFFVSCAPEEEPCTKLWSVESSGGSVIIEIDESNGELSLQGNEFGGWGGEIYQSYISGDFEAIADFKNFTSGTGGGRPFIEMIMYNGAVPDTILDTTTIVAGITKGYIYSGIGPATIDADQTFGTNGSFIIKRLGTTLTAMVISGADTARVQKVYSVAPTRFGFRIGSFNDSIVTGISGLKITKFQVIGSNDATLEADDFDCNSVFD